MVTQSSIPEIRAITLNLRWVFFILFALHIFGDILLGRTVRRIKSFDVLAIVFIIYAFLSIFYSPFPQLTLERATTILLLYISVFWIIWKYAYSQGPEKIVYLILQVAMIIFIAGYLMIFIGPYRAFFHGRFEGIFQNPNSIGIICALLIPLSLWKFLETKKKSALILFFLMLASLLLSASRGSINATVIGLGYFIYIRSKKYRPLVFSFTMSFVLILIWIVETLAKQYFIGYIRAETLPTGAGRFEVWPIALNLIIDKPILGYGFGIEEKILQIKHIVPHLHPGGYFHNSYLGMMLQLGIPGFIIFYTPLLILIFKEVFLRQNKQISSLRYALQASVIAGLSCAFFESWVYSVGNSQAFPFWVIVMLLTFYHYKDKEEVIADTT